MRDELQSLHGLSFPEPDITKMVKNTVTFNCLALEKSYSRFVLLPETDNNLLKTLIQANSLTVKLTKGMKKLVDRMKSEYDELDKKFKGAMNEIKNVREKTSETIRGFIGANQIFETKELKE
jgi:hypothetical protein